MFIVVIILSVIILWSNLKAYKTLFVPDKYLIKEAKEKLDTVKEEEKGLGVFIAILFGILPIAFYSIAANVFIENKFLMSFAVLEIIITLISLKKIISFISYGKEAKRGIILRLLTPINTVFIGYFIYYYIMNL